MRIYRSDYPARSDPYDLCFKNRSTCFTQFPNDIPIYAKHDKKIKLTVMRRTHVEYDMKVEDSPYDELIDETKYEYPDYIPPKDNDINNDDSYNEINNNNIGLYNIKKENDKKQYMKLNQTKSTSLKSSYGYINAGSNLGIRLILNKNVYKVTLNIKGDNSIKCFDDKTKRFHWNETVSQNQEAYFNNLVDYYDFYSKSNYEMNINNSRDKNVFTFEYLVPYMTKQTLHSWNSLRNVEEDIFSIDKEKIFSRISNPYEIEFTIYELVTKETKEGTETYTKITKKNIFFDVFDCWNNLYNRDLSKYHISSNNTKINNEDWINGYE